MKRRGEFNVTITCGDCGTKELFTAGDVNQLFKAMDRAGWHDFPGEVEPHSGKAWCPECHRKGQQGGTLR